MMFNNAKYMFDEVTKKISTIRFDNENGTWSYVPIDESNGDYRLMMQLVEGGELTIEPPDIPDAVLNTAK